MFLWLEKWLLLMKSSGGERVHSLWAMLPLTTRMLYWFWCWSVLTRKWKPVLSSNLKPPQLSVFCGFWECSQSCRPYCRPTALHACVTHGLYCTRIDFIGVSSIKVLISRPRLLSDHLPDRYFVINDNYFILFLTRKIRSSICSFMHAF